MLLFITNNAWAVITQQSAVLSNDLNGDGIAGIGDTITYSCRSTTADPSQFPFIDLSIFGNAYQQMVQTAGQFYTFVQVSIPAGSIENNTPRTFTFQDEGGTYSSGGISVDNRRPNSIYGPVLSGYTGPGAVYKNGDTLRIDITMSTSFDSDTPRSNLSSIGLGGNEIFAGPGGNPAAPEFSLSRLFPPNQEGVGVVVPVTATDDAGNANQWQVSLSYDTKVPEIQSVLATNMTTNSDGSAKEFVTTGDTIRITATVSEYDYDTLTASNTILFPGGPATLIRVNGNTPGEEAVYQYDCFVTDATRFKTNFLYFQVTAKDDVGNISNIRNSNPLKLDNIPPEFQGDITINITEKGGHLGDGIAIIGDELSITGSLSSVMTDVTLTVDLSGIGGVSNQILSLDHSGAATTFSLNYDIHQYTSENTTPRYFTIIARDEAKNEISKITTPVIYVDNNPPVLTDAQVQNASLTGQPVRHSHLLGIQANVTNLDNGSVWTALERVGGTASSTLAPYVGNTYRLDHVVGDPSLGLPYDQNISFTVYAKDDAGNMVFRPTNAISIDNEKPKVLGSRYISSPVLSATHPYVKIDDRITFRVQLASSTSGIHDSETVHIDLSQLGVVDPVQMIYDGIGSYTYSMDVPAGELDNNFYFAFTARDNAGNTDAGSINVPIDNKLPDAGPMVINFMTDMNKSGVVNVGDKLEFIIPSQNPDAGTCTLDLSYVGGPSAQIVNYDPVLKRYHHIHDCVAAAMENTSYVFKASLTDKAGNTMNSVSSVIETDCVEPVINSASAIVQNFKGKADIINIGDKISITANVDLSKLDGGTPIVNLTSVGGGAGQVLYDDGAHDDSLANDGIYGYTHTVTAGTTDRVNMAFTVELTDNAGNRATAATQQFMVDNKPLSITSLTNTQVFDSNGNDIVDLDGIFTTYPTIATDVIRLEANIVGDSGDMGTMTVDLTPLGINNTAYELAYTVSPTGWKISEDIMPNRGTTNNEQVALTVKLTDNSGNEIIQTCSNQLTVDNRGPTIEVYPIAFTLDEGRLNEANAGDRIQFKAKLNWHDGQPPHVDFEQLYLSNGLTPPGVSFMNAEVPGGNVFVLEWTVPEGMGTVASLPILAFDYSGNMTVGYTAPIRFLSKIPSFSAFPQTRCDLTTDSIPAGRPNNIANPGDRVTITATLKDLYSANNTPPAVVLANVRSLINSADDDSLAKYNDGDYKTYWTALTYQAAQSGAGNYVYRDIFDVQAGGIDANVASFAVKVLHPDVTSIVMAESVVGCDPNNKFGIDTEIPNVVSANLDVLDENDDNIASNSININDLLQIRAEINKYIDPGSVTAVLYMPDNTTQITQVPLYNTPATDNWSGQVRVATHTLTGWPALDGIQPRYRILVTDDADNFYENISKAATFTVDNTAPEIVSSSLKVSPNNNAANWVANVGDGSVTATGDLVPPDGIVASLTVSNGADLTGYGMAYIDMTPIGGTSTYILTNEVGAQAYSDPLELATMTYDLATRTFKLYVKDGAGNTAMVEQQLAVDTMRPHLKNASYNGSMLTLEFNESIRYQSLQDKIDKIRVGKRLDLTGAANKEAFAILNADDEVYPLDGVTQNIQLSSATKGIIADWGATNLYISIAHDTLTGEANGGVYDPLALDISGNWLTPLPQLMATMPVTITNIDYTNRPQFATGIYNASTVEGRKVLTLRFNKFVDMSTITPESLKKLSIWKNRGNAMDDYSNRYRFNLGATDTVRADSIGQELNIELSEEAQEWIAINYTRSGSMFHIQIDGMAYEPPPYPSGQIPLLRDIDGNMIVPIHYSQASAATLIPLNTQFSVHQPVLDFAGAQPVLSLKMQETTGRKIRLYTDPYKNQQSIIERSTEIPIDLSRIYIHAQSDLQNGSFALNSNMVDMQAFKAINPDYASDTIRIPLRPDAMKTMLSWGTSNFYVACDNGALTDLWGNQNLRYPFQGNEAAQITTQNLPLINRPTIQTLAVSPVVNKNNYQLAKGQTVGNFFYEVAFDTATVSADVYVPIDRTKTPVLEFYTQSDIAMTSPKDTATFVGWLDHTQGGIVRTVARFTNNSDLAAAGNVQREPMVVKVSNFTDIFNNPSLYDETASLSYNLAEKDTSLNGFQNSSYTILLDNQVPTPTQVIPTGTIGITPAGGMMFDVAFDEPMDQTANSNFQPSLRLGDSSTTIMNFTFQSWTDSQTARFSNSTPFQSTTPQGTYTYYISGGYDEAGNRGKDNVALDKVYVRSRGPNITSYSVTTYQSTTAKFPAPTGNVIDQPFSPYVPSGIATITVNFQTAPNNPSLWLHIYQGEASLASMPMTVSGLVGTAQWDGNLSNGPIGPNGPTKYALRIYDDAGNEGSIRGEITYDGQAPNVSSWNFTNVKTWNGKAYFSPAISSFVKVDAYGPSAGQSLYMRLTHATTPTEVYPMTDLSGGGYTISFDGQNTNVPAGTLVDGEYMVSIVDKAGNVGVKLGVNGQATSTLVIDRTAPLISSIQLLRVDNAQAVTRFNPRVTDLKIQVNSTDPTVGSGTAMIKIMAGSTLIKEIPLQGGGPAYSAIWDGTDNDLQPVNDGTYKITVVDLAGNVSTQQAVDVDVVNSIFKITDLTQIDKNHIRITFSHDVNVADAQNPMLYTITPANPVGLGVATPITVDGKVVEATLNGNLTHDILYTLTVTPGYKSVDDDPIAAGDNSAQFTADGQGPVIKNITYDGLNSQKKFNVVFDEQLEAASSQQIGNYQLTTGTDTVAIESISLRADLKSVTITAFDDIVELKNYTIVASGVKDLFNNESDGNVARKTFQGKDITPPELTITAFSNPANEFDISVAVSSNEDLSGAPTAVITQSGGTAVSIVLNAGPNNRLFIGGAHLDMNYPGVATIKVTGTDVSANTGTANMSFSTAYVNSSVRAEIKSADKKFAAVFEPGTLKSNTVVSILPEALTKVKATSINSSVIVPSVFKDLTVTQLKSIRANSLNGSNDADELTPIGQAYTVNMAAGRIVNPVNMKIKVDAENRKQNVGLYYNDLSNGWKLVSSAINNGEIEFSTLTAGTFALLKDEKAPRANLTSGIKEGEPVREARPSFTWSIEELGSGLEPEKVSVFLNGEEYPAMVDETGKVARFKPIKPLLGGEYDLSIKASDKAGNTRITPAIRFQAIPPVQIYEVTQYPNPAHRRVAIRISSNRNDIDWNEIEVKIYDVAGHKVADTSNLNLRNRADGTRLFTDVMWDLRNKSGKNVANGVYFAKITLRDPDNWNIKTKYVHKLAVLR